MAANSEADGRGFESESAQMIFARYRSNQLPQMWLMLLKCCSRKKNHLDQFEASSGIEILEILKSCELQRW